DVIAPRLPADFRRDDDQQHSREVAQHGKGQRERHEQQPFPRRTKNKKSVNRGEQKNGDETAHAAARRRNVKSVAAGGIEQLRSHPDHVNSQNVRHLFRKPRNQLPQGKRNELGALSQRNGKHEQKKREQAVPQPGAPPCQPHQPVNAAEQRGDGKIGLLQGVARDVQRQRRQQNQQARPPEFQRLRQQLPPLPPKKPDDQKRDEIAVAAIVLFAANGVGIIKPREKRRRMDIAQDGIAPKLEQQQPGRQQREEKSLVRQPMPAFNRVRPPVYRR